MFDPALIQASQRRALANELRDMTPQKRREKVEQTRLKTGGTLIPQQPKSNWGPVNAELTLLGLFETGSTVDETIINWINTAKRATAMGSTI